MTAIESLRRSLAAAAPKLSAELEPLIAAWIEPAIKRPNRTGSP